MFLQIYVVHLYISRQASPRSWASYCTINVGTVGSCYKESIYMHVLESESSSYGMSKYLSYQTTEQKPVTQNTNMQCIICDYSISLNSHYKTCLTPHFAPLHHSTTSHLIRPDQTKPIPPRLTTPVSSEPSKQDVVRFPVNAHRVDTGFSFIPSPSDCMCEIPIRSQFLL